MLSQRETEIVRLAAEGYRDREIARELILAEYTVKDYMVKLRYKLGARNRTHAVALALRSGIVE